MAFPRSFGLLEPKALGNTRRKKEVQHIIQMVTPMFVVDIASFFGHQHHSIPHKNAQCPQNFRSSWVFWGSLWVTKGGLGLVNWGKNGQPSNPAFP